MTIEVTLTPIVDLTEAVAEGELVTINVGPDKQVYALVHLGKYDDRDERPGGPTFAKVGPQRSQSYRITSYCDGEKTSDVRIDDERFNIHDVQPLPKDELLLVCCRSRYESQEVFDRNGRVYSCDGRFRREILLGDGIQSVQCTSDGVIWTSFFDEGVFGNFGWSQPVGASGLIAWNTTGKKLYEFEPTSELDPICDCYALNVESDNSTWLYYYTEFPLVQLRGQRIERHWQVPIAGSSAFAVGFGYALFSGGYEERDSYFLVDLRNGESSKEATAFHLVDAKGRRLTAGRIVGRADGLYLCHEQLVYRFDIEMAFQAIK